MKFLRVKDHTAFARFEYKSTPAPGIETGDVVIQKETNEVGVVLQTHGDSEFRTDMFGNECMSQVRPATLSEIAKYRPDVVEHLDLSLLK